MALSDPAGRPSSTIPPELHPTAFDGLWRAACLFWLRITRPRSHGGETMLVLSRKIGEAIIIDGCIRVTITAVKGNQVRIGISAPPEVSVDREEVDRRRTEYAEPERVFVEA